MAKLSEKAMNNWNGQQQRAAISQIFEDKENRCQYMFSVTGHDNQQ